MNKAIMYGAGKIGRGFIAQLFSQSGYKVVFIDVDLTVIKKLNRDNYYPIRMVAEGEYKEEIVENVRAVYGKNIEEVAKEIADADIMATAVGVNALTYIIEHLVTGLIKRWDQGNFNPLNIIICENLIDANTYLENLIQEKLSEKQKEYFKETVGLVKASIGKMVPDITEKMQGDNPLRVWVEPYNKLPVDKEGFKGTIPNIKNMNPFTPFNYFIQRKLYMHNMAHAITSYLGYLKGYTYIYEAIKDPAIKYIVNKALEETAVALVLKHNVSIKDVLNHGDNLIYRFSNKLLGDTVARVGRDPIRKLANNDRLIGAANFCLEQDLNPINIALGIAAGYHFTPAEDEGAREIQEMIKEQGIKKAIKKYSKIEDIELFNLVIDFIKRKPDGLALGMNFNIFNAIRYCIKNSN